MSHRILALITFLLIAIGAQSAYAQAGWNFDNQGDIRLRKNWLRLGLAKLRADFQIGPGVIIEDFDRNNRALFSNADGELAILDDGSIYSGWAYSPSVVAADRFNQVMENDTVSFDPFRAVHRSMPIQLILQGWYDRYRIGGGIGFERFGMNPYEISELELRSSTVRASRLRYFFTAGATWLQYGQLGFATDIQMGSMSWLGDHQGSSGFYINFGFPVEWHFSEYLRAYLRPSIEFNSYATFVGNEDRISAFDFSQTGIFLTFGISFNNPEIPLCRKKACQARKKHTHTNRAYRAQPFYKIQNPGIGQQPPNTEKLRRRP
ncbi:MAG: hypothetical protein LAT68_15535 [Cyclobacteriaceae bacterium]|nr:hypothetical protein [Cyclobacteriaceae bacterium]MCH8517734.1 hypothetical protein [Cyclobacteriaceae bacterium]